LKFGALAAGILAQVNYILVSSFLAAPGRIGKGLYEHKYPSINHQRPGYSFLHILLFVDGRTAR
jgi:hypothetical protein